MIWWIFGESETWTVKKFTWRQKSPIIQKCLDHWLISDTLQEDVVKSDIVTTIKTNHLATTLKSMA